MLFNVVVFFPSLLCYVSLEIMVGVKKHSGCFEFKIYRLKYFQYEIYEVEIMMSTPQIHDKTPDLPFIAMLSEVYMQYARFLIFFISCRIIMRTDG